MTAPEWAAVAIPAAGALGTPIGLGLRALGRGFSALAREVREMRVKVEVMTELAERRVSPQIKRRADASPG